MTDMPVMPCQPMNVNGGHDRSSRSSANLLGVNIQRGLPSKGLESTERVSVGCVVVQCKNTSTSTSISIYTRSRERATSPSWKIIINRFIIVIIIIIIIFIIIMEGGTLSGFSVPGMTMTSSPSSVAAKEIEELSPWSIHLSMLAVVTVVIGVTMAFELLQEYLVEHTSEEVKPVLEHLFGELTVLGFIGLIVFVVVKSGGMDEIARRAFPNATDATEVCLPERTARAD